MVLLSNMNDTQSMILSVRMLLQEQETHEILERSQSEPVHTISEIIKDDLSPNVVNIDGILIPIFEKDNVQNGNLVPVKSTVNNLRSLALAVASGKIFLHLFVKYLMPTLLLYFL